MMQNQPQPLYATFPSNKIEKAKSTSVAGSRFRVIAMLTKETGDFARGCGEHHHNEGGNLRDKMEEMEVIALGERHPVPWFNARFNLSSPYPLSS